MKLLEQNKKQKEEIKKQKEENAKLAEELGNVKEKRTRNLKNIEDYDIDNFRKFLRTADAKAIFGEEGEEKKETYINPQYYAYDEENTAFDRLKRNKKFFDYQQQFIEDWTVSSQELVILYYGVGSGKTTIAINCAEQFQALNNDAHVYILTPASLVLGTIKECYDRGIDPTRKNNKGEYIYYFVSYQQLLNSKFDFKDNSLLIIDEAHNLRNIQAKEISEKESARKYVKTGNYSLVGNVLATKLIHSSSKFLRSIFMTGTLFVNSEKDIEALISIGYKKQPMLDIDEIKYDSIMHSDKEFKIYYEGLISFYRLSENDVRFPKKKYHFENIPSDEVILLTGRDLKEFDSYFRTTRTQATQEKFEWINKFMKTQKGKRTLIYSQFLTKKIKPLEQYLNILGFKVGIISGELNQKEKLDLVSQYNNRELDILIFTLAIKEGISFKETNNVIVIEPYWNYAIMEQIIARAVRATSHAKGQKSTVEVYFLVATATETDVDNDKWIDSADKAMNNNIKDLIYPLMKVKTQEGEVEAKDKGAFANNNGSRDIDLFNRMFNKQESINVFEKRLLALPKFEEVNNVENNSFTEAYKNYILFFEQQNGRHPSNKELINKKRELYKNIYDEKIKELDSRILRFNKDTRYKTNRKPDLAEKLHTKDYGNKTEMIKEMIKNNKTLEQMFIALGIDKKEITQFQANFTPINEINVIIERSNIINDKRNNIKILEPTSGIGGVVGQLLTLPNKQNFMIDSNEFHNAFYQIGVSIYDGIDNVKWYNSDFWIYMNKYNYDYIFGNPPFNLQTQIIEETIFTKRKGEPDPDPKSIFKKVDKTLYDIHFVSKAYNMLSDNGILSMIISDRYLRDTTIPAFRAFNEYLKQLTKYSCYTFEYIGGFKGDKGVVKSQETKFPMVAIWMKKYPEFNIDLDDVNKINKRVIKVNYNEEDAKNNFKSLKEDVKIEDILRGRKKKIMKTSASEYRENMTKEHREKWETEKGIKKIQRQYQKKEKALKKAEEEKKAKNINIKFDDEDEDSE